MDGEFLEGDNIRYIHSPGKFHIWDGREWVYDIELEKASLNDEIQTTEREMEAAQAQIVSRKSLGMYTETLETRINGLLKKHSDLCYDLSKLKEV